MLKLIPFRSHFMCLLCSYSSNNAVVTLQHIIITTYSFIGWEYLVNLRINNMWVSLSHLIIVNFKLTQHSYHNHSHLYIVMCKGRVWRILLPKQPINNSHTIITIYVNDVFIYNAHQHLQTLPNSLWRIKIKINPKF